MNHEAEVEERLAASMREHVAGIALDSEVLSRAGRRYQRRKVLQRGLFGTAAMAVAAIAVFAVTTGTTATPQVAQEDRDTAQARLVAAVTASQSTSYQVTISVQTTTEVKDKNRSMTFTGAYDPASDSGYLRSGEVEERIVAGVRYLVIDGEAKEVPLFKVDPLGFEWPGGQGFLGTSADPRPLLDSLRRRDAKITETGKGAFHFELTLAREVPSGKWTVAFSGDIAVGPDNRVARITYKSLVSARVTAEIMTAMEFSGYGTPVRVEKP